MATTRIVNPRVYTKDSFYYQFVWEWEVINDQGETIVGANPNIDLNKEYEVMLYKTYNIPYNENKSFIVKYNTPISFLDIYNLYKEDGLLQRGANVKFKIREKQENDLNDWSDLFPSESSFLLAPSVINCSAVTNNAKNQMSVTVGPEFRNYYKNNVNNYSLTTLKEVADKISVYVSHKNEELVYEPQTDHTAHLEWDADWYGDQWIRFDFESITKIANFSGLHLISNVTPVSCDLQISDGSTINDARTQSVIVHSDSDRIYPNDFTKITIDKFGESDWSAVLFVTGYVDNEVIEETQVNVGNTIDVSSYDYFTFRVQYYTGTTTSVDYTVNEQQWETIEEYPLTISGHIEVTAENIECSSIRLRGNFIGAINDDLSVIANCIIPNQDSYKQETPLSLAFDFDLNYNSELALETEYNLYVSEEKISSWGRDDKTTIIIPQEEHNISNIDFTKQIEIPTPSYQGGLIYIKQGYGWKINGTNVSPGETVDCLHGSLKKEKIIIDKNEEEGIFSPLHIIIYGVPNEQEIKFNNRINFLTGAKYAQQIESFDDLNTIRPISNISNNEFTYQYDSINEHTPVFIYQKMIDNTYNLTNDLSNLNTGILNTDFENISKNNLKVTTFPVINYDYNKATLPAAAGYSSINVQNYKSFIVSTIEMLTEGVDGDIQISFDEDTAFENAQIVQKGSIINVNTHDYIRIKFTNSSNSGAALIKYFLSTTIDDNSIKTEHISEEELNEYLEEHQDMLNVNKVFNSLKEEFIWQTFNITQETGQPKLIINAQKDNFSDLYSYKILIQNQISNREIVKQELDLKYSNVIHLWRIYKNNMSYPDGYVLSNLVNNELSSKEKYHIIIKRIYNGDEYIIDERDVEYENNTDFFLAPSNNINYNPGEKDNFYFSTERNDSENAAQGYPWLIYNNDEDNVSYFCYSNQAYNNNADNRGIDNYDSNKSDNKQLIHINYHDKPNFTPKEVIPMLDFKITELVETTTNNIINPSFIFNQTNIVLAPSSNGVNVQTNGENASFTLSTSFIDNGYLSFNGGSIFGMGQIEILDNDTEQILFSTANSGSCFVLTNLWNGKYVNNNTGLSFNFKSNGYISFYNTRIQTLKKPETDTLLNKRKFYIDNFSVNEIDYSEIENGSTISGQVLELHKPITLHIEDFTTNMSSNDSVYYKIEKINEYNQEVVTPIDDDNSITILQKDDKDNVFTKDFYINSYTNQLKIQNTKTKQITFNNAQKDTIVNCILEKEEVED